MADTQRIHTANEDINKAAATHEKEQKSPLPSVSLAPKSSLMTEKGDPGAAPDQIVHFQISKNMTNPLGQNPRFYSRPPKSHRNLCYSWFALIIHLLLLFILAIGIAAGIIYAVYQPRMPKYSVENFQMTSFAIATDGTVSSQFVVEARATNPNKKVGIYYLDSNYLAVFYSGTELSRGQPPAFYQGPKTTTTLTVVLTGTDVQITSKKITLLNEQLQDGTVPLRLKVDVPVKVKFGNMKTMKITFRVRCDLVVSRVNGRNSSNIGKKHCKVKL